MNIFDENIARETAEQNILNNSEKLLIDSFIEVCRFLGEYPKEISWRTSKKIPIDQLFSIEMA